MPWLKDAQVTSFVNSQLPLRLNDYTTLTSFSLRQKHSAYQFELDEGAPHETASEIKERMMGDLCAYWRPQFRDRSIASATYGYRAPWGDLSFTVTSADCP